VRSTELVADQPPYVAVESHLEYREPSAIALSAGSIAVYATAGTASSSHVVRFVSDAAHSLGPPTTVLSAAETWEGGMVRSPCAIARGDGTWLYYAASDGIGLARAPDGVSFTNAHQPVLSRDGATAWEAGEAPGAPSVVLVADGTLRMFYEAAGAIGEASSTDGLAWHRVGDRPVLAARTDATGPAGFDAAAVEGPAAVLYRGADGREILRLYYAGRDRGGAHAIGLAARDGSSGPFVRAVGPVLTDMLDPRDPSVLALGGVSYLFVTRTAGPGTLLDYPAIALAVAPATIELPTVADAGP
jgi:hypothetical protein